LATSDNDAVSEWLARLDELQPADGRFTRQVLAAAGEFPVYKPPGDAFDNRNDPVKASQHFDGTVARRFAFEMAQFRVTTATAKASKASGELAERYELNARYWSEITEWLKTLL
jgi:hypothetical protein